jgi:hypothetical protein
MHMRRSRNTTLLRHLKAQQQSSKAASMQMTSSLAGPACHAVHMHSFGDVHVQHTVSAAAQAARHVFRT